MFARKYYNATMPGFSIAAMEHSTVTSWGQENEEASYRNMLKVNGQEGVPIAFVSDSYDIYKACKMWGTKLKQDVIDSGAVVVIRPDSGDPAEVVTNCLIILERYFGSVVNAKGYKVLNNVRVIQGDGINHASIRQILARMVIAGFSADNVAFGQGGALLQAVDRDTMRFAMKCSSVGVREGDRLVWRDVFKAPATDPGKASKKGRVTLMKNRDGTYYSGREDWPESVLQEVYRNGELLIDVSFDEVRANARK